VPARYDGESNQHVLFAQRYFSATRKKGNTVQLHRTFQSLIQAQKFNIAYLITSCKKNHSSDFSIAAAFQFMVIHPPAKSHVNPIPHSQPTESDKTAHFNQLFLSLTFAEATAFEEFFEIRARISLLLPMLLRWLRGCKPAVDTRGITLCDTKVAGVEEVETNSLETSFGDSDAPVTD
jgi:hypothetical protein